MKTNIRKSCQWLILAVFAMVLCVMAGNKTAYASNLWNVKVDTSYLALRTAKAFDASNEIGKLYTGDVVDVIDTSDATYWYVYSSKCAKYGYVNKNYLVQTAQSQQVNVSNVYKVAKLQSGYLALRSAKVYDNNNIIGQLYNDDLVTLIDSSDTYYWYVFSEKLNKYGYVNKDYLEQVVSANSYVVSNLQSGYLALRTAKAFDASNEIGKLYNGDTVTVSDSSDPSYWYVYSAKLNKSGYVNKNYLAPTAPAPVTADTYVVSDLQSGYLALRTAKAYDASNEIGKLYNGDTVTVSDKSDASYWYVYSAKLGMGGYVNKNYLKAQNGTPAPSGNSYKWYTVTSSYQPGIALRTIADSNADVLTRLPQGAIFCVTAYSGSFGYTTYNGYSGWVNLDYAALRN